MMYFIYIPISRFYLIESIKVVHCIMNVAELRLIKLSRTGDRSAFNKLVELYQNKIQRLGYRMLLNKPDTDDIVQETFIRVYLNLNSYDENQKFSTWIYKICKNACIDFLRKRKPLLSLDSPLEDGSTYYQKLPVVDESPEFIALRSEIKDEIHHALTRLPEKYRVCIQLYYLEELSLQEISTTLDIPVTTVKTRIHRGRELLKSKWKMNVILMTIILFIQGSIWS